VYLVWVAVIGESLHKQSIIHLWHI